MKTIIASVLVTLSATLAQAAPVYCTTNVNHDPRAASTNLTINSSSKLTTVTQSTAGGMAHFVTAPKTFAVAVSNEGPELVLYTNAEEGFELSISYQPIGSAIRGNLITESLGQRIERPVVCVAAMN